MKDLSAEAIVLLRKIEQHILAEPRRLDMDFIGQTSPKMLSEYWPPCGTVGCIAGWASLLSLKEIPKDAGQRREAMSWERGQEALGLDKMASYRLFNEPRVTIDLDEDETDEGYLNHWPFDFAERYVVADTKGDLQERAKVTVERIEHFIATNGNE